VAIEFVSVAFDTVESKSCEERSLSQPFWPSP
jgi:hypothetical protein